MDGISLERVTKEFHGGVIAVDDVSLEIEPGEFVVLVGPSGCGKSTLLRMISGLEAITSGSMSIGGRDVTDKPPRDRDIAMVFQSYALYPHMNVRQNLGYGLKVRKTPKADIDARVTEVAGLLGLEELLDRRPGALSGGQRQRVAMGRAIVREPAAFLMDEPLSNLDSKLRVGMRTELARLHARLGVTTVYVTHDQVEAMTLGQRVAVMRDGRIQQVDAPATLYQAPVNVFVASFIGSPSMNLVEATLEDDVVSFADAEIRLDSARRPRGFGPRRVILGIRPEAFEWAELSDPEAPRLVADVTVVEDIGSDTHVIFPVAAPGVDPLVSRGPSGVDRSGLLADDRAMFNARVNPRARPKPGSRMTLAVDPRALHFFDAETGESLLMPEASPVGASAHAS